MLNAITYLLFTITLAATSTAALAKYSDPCEGGNLKGWAKNAGYTQEACSTSSEGSTDGSTTDNTAGSDPAICDGDKLKGWAKKAGYTSEDCSGTTTDTNTGGDATEPNVNTDPLLAITAPLANTSFAEGSAITFSATAVDNEDGDLSSMVSWQSSLDGVLSGTVVASSGEQSLTTTLSIGQHTITATVTDSAGVSKSDQIQITINAAEIPQTASAILRWEIPTSRENGEPLALEELGGYELYVTTESTGEIDIITIDDPAVTTYTFSELTTDVYYFAMSAFDIDGQRGPLSETITKTVGDLN